MDRPKLLRIETRVSFPDDAVDGFKCQFLVPFCFDERFVSCFFVHENALLSGSGVVQKDFPLGLVGIEDG